MIRLYPAMPTPARPALGRRIAVVSATGLLATVVLAAPVSAHPAAAQVSSPAAASAAPALSTAAPVTPAVRRARFGKRVLSEARRHVGKPYVYGSTGPATFDCSGYVGYVYDQLGVALPRDSYSQYAAVEHIPASAAVPGDLIWVGGLGHVAIYAGHGMMYDAPHSGAVVGYHPIYGSYVAGRVRR